MFSYSMEPEGFDPQVVRKLMPYLDDTISSRVEIRMVRHHFPFRPPRAGIGRVVCGYGGSSRGLSDRQADHPMTTGAVGIVWHPSCKLKT